MVTGGAQKSAVHGGGEEKNAAWLLMKLSVRDGEAGGDTVEVDTRGDADTRDAEEAIDAQKVEMGSAAREKSARSRADDAPRVKRRRATSY